MLAENPDSINVATNRQTIINAVTVSLPASTNLVVWTAIAGPFLAGDFASI